MCPRCKTQPKLPKVGYCRDCRNQHRRDRYRANHDQAKRQVRLDAWKRNGINITWQEYEQLHENQNGLCAICRRPPHPHDLHVDHDHTTGRIRGLLCLHCNTALGHAQDDPQLLRQLADYLDHHTVTVS